MAPERRFLQRVGPAGREEGWETEAGFVCLQNEPPRFFSLHVAWVVLPGYRRPPCPAVLSPSRRVGAAASARPGPGSPPPGSPQPAQPSRCDLEPVSRTQEMGRPFPTPAPRTGPASPYWAGGGGGDPISPHLSPAEVPENLGAKWFWVNPLTCLYPILPSLFKQSG